MSDEVIMWVAIFLPFATVIAAAITLGLIGRHRDRARSLDHD